jgi:hypothetical protein
MIPSKYYFKTTEHLSPANSSKMHIEYKLSIAYVSQNSVCFKTSFVLIKNLPNSQVILGNPFLCLLYPFITDSKGLQKSWAKRKI